MITVEDIKKANSIYSIPKTIHVNRDIILDSRLFYALSDYDPEKDYIYDFDVFLPKYGINLQRDYVWEHCQQNEFILSILLEKPIESVVVVQHNNYDLSKRNTTNYVIDGKQRLLTIKKFVNNEFPVSINGKEVYFKDFSDELRLFFKSRVNYITATVYYSYDDIPVTDDMKIVLFNYFNFTGTPQTEAHKNKLQSLLAK